MMTTMVDSKMMMVDNEVLYIGRMKVDDLECQSHCSN